MLRAEHTALHAMYVGAAVRACSADPVQVPEDFKHLSHCPSSREVTVTAINLFAVERLTSRKILSIVLA